MLQTRIITGLLCLITITAGYFVTYTAGWSDGYEQRDLEARAENEAVAVAALATEKRHSDQIIGAINARNEKTKSNQRDAAGADLERNRVRLSFDAVGAGLQPPSAACSKYAAAERQLLSSIANGVDDLTRTAERIAAEADGHAADSLMYQQSWPK
jgi:hypothetical protein